MAPRWRKAALIAHIAASVGWLGSVLTFLALTGVGLVSEDGELSRSVFRVMEPVGWYAIMPLNVASLITGLISSLGTSWGLFRHYWVLAKLLINVVATVVLLLYLQTLEHLSRLAASGRDVSQLKDPSTVVHATASVVLLLLAMILAVYKPRGLTPYGQRRQARPDSRASRRPAPVDV